MVTTGLLGALNIAHRDSSRTVSLLAGTEACEKTRLSTSISQSSTDPPKGRQAMWLQANSPSAPGPPRSYLHQEGMQPVALAVWHVQLGKHHRVSCRFAHVAHPKFGSLEIRGM